MKYLIFSDTHLGKDFDEKKFLFLKKIITESDQVIINGDFWEGLQLTFDEFINSPWKGLFPYLKQKKTVYIYGNHDLQEWSDQRVSLFSNSQTEQYIFTSGNKTFIVEHGNKTRILVISITKNLSKILALFTHKNPQIAFQLEKLIFSIFGKDVHQLLAKKANNRIKQRAKNFAGNRILICGHSHAQELDLTNNFVGIGMINFGLAQYCIIEDGKLLLEQKWYN